MHWPANVPIGRSDLRRALAIIRDGGELHPEFRERVTSAICQLTGKPRESVDMAAAATEIIAARYRVAKLVELLNQA